MLESSSMWCWQDKEHCMFRCNFATDVIFSWQTFQTAVFVQSFSNYTVVDFNISSGAWSDFGVALLGRLSVLNALFGNYRITPRWQAAASDSLKSLLMSFLVVITMTHLNASDLQTLKTSAFTEALNTRWWSVKVHLNSGTWLLLTILIPVQAAKVYFSFSHTASAFWLNFVKWIMTRCHYSCATSDAQRHVVHLRLYLPHFKT